MKIRVPQFASVGFVATLAIALVLGMAVVVRSSSPVQAQDGAQPPNPPDAEIVFVGSDLMVFEWAQPTTTTSPVNGSLLHVDGTYVRYDSSTHNWVRPSEFPGDGVYTVTIRTQDTEGRNSSPVDLTVELNNSFFVVDGPDTVAPNSPPNVEANADGGAVSVTWNEAPDNVETTGYLVHRNNAYQGYVPAASDLAWFDSAAPSDGRPIAYDVRAQDAAGNVSDPVRVKVTLGGSTVVPSRTRLQAVHSGKCLRWNAAPSEWAPLQQNTCRNQPLTLSVWFLDEIAPDQFQIRNVGLSTSCITVEDSQANGAWVGLEECAGLPTQTYTIEQVDGGVRFVAAHSGKCLDVSGISLLNRARIQQWSCSDTDNQHWTYL